MTADRDALLDLLGALDRLGLEGLNDDGQGGATYRGAVAYGPPILFALRDAARRARRHVDRTPESTGPVDDLRGVLIRVAVGYVSPGERDTVGLQRQAEQQAARLADELLPIIEACDADAHALTTARRQGRDEVLRLLDGIDPDELAAAEDLGYVQAHIRDSLDRGVDGPDHLGQDQGA